MSTNYIPARTDLLNAAVQVSGTPPTGDAGIVWNQNFNALNSKAAMINSPQRSGVYNAKIDFTVVGDGQRASTASMTSGQATLTVVSSTFTDADVGKPILVIGAGITSGNKFYDLSSTIKTIVTLNTVILNDNAGTTVSNTDVYWGTDDTAAIQAAMDTVAALGKTLYFPSSIYMVSGAIQTMRYGVNYSAQLCIPFVSQPSSPVPFTIIGDPVNGPYDQFDGCRPSIIGTIFLSTLNAVNASGDSFPGIFGTTTSYGAGSLAFSQCALVMEDILIRRPHNSGLACLDLETNATCELYNIFIDTTVPVFSILQPTQVSIGIRTPGYNNEAKVIVQGCFVEGCYFGMDLQEHASALDPWIQACIVGMRFRSGYHYVEVRHAVLVANVYQINFSPITAVAVTPINMTATIEAQTTNSSGYPAWMRQTATVHDPTPYGVGRLLYHMVEGGVGINPAVFVNNQPPGSLLNCTSVTPVATPAVYASGTVYSLTATQAPIAFGTTSPNLTLAAAGRYKVRARINLKFNNATLTAARTITLKVRRTNNTAADLVGSITVIVAPVVAAVTATFMVVELPEVIYNAAAGDAIALYGALDATTGMTNTIDCVEASMIAEAIGVGE